MDTVNMKDFVPIASWVVFTHLFLMQKMAWLMNSKLRLWALHIKFYDNLTPPPPLLAEI